MDSEKAKRNSKYRERERKSQERKRWCEKAERKSEYRERERKKVRREKDGQ